MFEASIDPFGGAGADDGVELVDEQHDLAGGVDDFLQHRLQAILELAAILRAGNQRAHVERDDLLVLQALGNVAADDALREPFDDGGLADAGFADQHGIVLGAARQHLDHAADFLVAADHRIELALARQLGQIAPVLLQRFVLAFGILIGHALAAAHGGQRLEHALARHPRAFSSSIAGDRPGLAKQAQQQMLGADELVLHRLGVSLRRIEHDAQARGEVRLRAAMRLRLLAEVVAHRLARRSPGSTLILRNTLGTTPPCCSASVTSRCSGSTCA